MTHKTAIKQGLEPIFAEHTELGQRYFYDKAEGKYYDAATDLFMGDDFDPANLLKRSFDY